MNNNYANAQGIPQALPKNSIQRLSDAMDEAIAMTSRLETLAERLCGPIPQDTGMGTNNSNQVVPAVFPALNAAAGQLSDCMARSSSALSRIEQEVF